ncbi:MAG TPA: glycosyltransferase [bacterium]|nr:glycosyltransferase [bacterium]
MRILFLTPFLPDPAAGHGGGSYLGALAEGLAKHAELGLVHLSHASDGVPQDLWSWRAAAAYPGEPRGAVHRLRMLRRWLSRPLLAAKYHQPAILPLLAQAEAHFRPDVALVEMAQMAQYLQHVSGCPTVFTDHEAGRPANATTGLGSWADRRDARLFRRYVQEHYQRASLLQAVSRQDADELAATLDRKVLVRPPTLAIPPHPAAPGRAPRRALFLGDYRHAPNPLAAERLAREVWPLVRAQHPDAELWLAGRNERTIRPLAALPGVRVTGFVDDLAALFAAVRLVLAPLWSGGGFRVKNATALAYGVPVVTNELGARGCRAPEPGCTVRELPAELAQATSQLLGSAELATTGSELARRWAVENLSADAVARRQLAHIERLLRVCD